MGEDEEGQNGRKLLGSRGQKQKSALSKLMDQMLVESVVRLALRLHVSELHAQEFDLKAEFEQL